MHQYLNFKKMAEISGKGWDIAKQYGLINISARHIGNNLLETPSGHQFINMCSCSYLGLDVHPKIIQGAIDEVRKMGTIHLTTARIRVHLTSLAETDEKLAQLFEIPVLSSVSCSTLSQHLLPIIASGVLTENESPVMIFDKEAHFSLNINKAVCGDETTVVTCPHNDMNFIEDYCKKNKHVAYIADGAYSMGGHAPVSDLIYLQEKYGLFLYFDDSHSLSAYGEKGCGYARSCMKDMSENTIIVASLSKAFGASGGMAMLGPRKHEQLIKNFTGPVLWSQDMNTAAQGAVQASIAIHLSPEINQLQKKLQDNITYFDQLINSAYAGSPLPIRVIMLGEPETALKVAKQIYDQGFYTSAVFFPIVPKGKAALRMMVRADMSRESILKFSQVLHEVAGVGRDER